MNLQSRIESILFVSSDPVSFEKISKVTGAIYEDVEDEISDLLKKYNESGCGINIISQDNEVQMVSNPENNDVVQELTDQEVKSELTRAQLEALTVIAYRAPITKPELEEIRGVNCSRIIRNLLMRGLIKEKDSSEKVVPVYKLSFNALRHLGINSVEELPNYEKLSTHENIEKLVSDE